MAPKRDAQGIEDNIQDDARKRIRLESDGWPSQVGSREQSEIQTQPQGVSVVLPSLTLQPPLLPPRSNPAVPQPSSRKNVKNIGYNRSAPPCSEGTLILNAFFQAFNFAWHTQERRLLCQLCEAFVPLEHALSHASPKKKSGLPKLHQKRIHLKAVKGWAKGKEGDNLRKQLEECFSEEVAKYGAENKTDLPNPNSSPTETNSKVPGATVYQAVEGIAVSDGLICTLCHACQMKRPMANHLRDHLKEGNSTTAIPFRIQTLYISSAKRRWFAVKEKPRAHGPDARTQTIMRLLNTRLAQLEEARHEDVVLNELDSRDSYPVLRKIGMMGFLSRFSTSSRIQGHRRTLLPQKGDPLYMVRSLVTTYVEKTFMDTDNGGMAYWNIRTLLRKDPSYVLSHYLQILALTNLSSNHKIETLSLFTNKSSKTRYCNTLIRLVCFILRSLQLPEGDRGFKLHTDQYSSAARLTEALLEGGSTELPLNEDLPDSDEDSNEDPRRLLFSMLEDNESDAEDQESDEEEVDDEESDNEGSDDEGSDDEGSDDEGSDDEGSDDEEPRNDPNGGSIDQEDNGRDRLDSDEDSSEGEDDDIRQNLGDISHTREGLTRQSDEESNSIQPQTSIGIPGDRDDRPENSRPSHLDLLHDFLFSLFSKSSLSSSNTVNGESPAHHAVSAYLWFHHIKDGKQYSSILTIPPTLSQLQYGIRVTVLGEVLRRHSRLEPSGSAQDIASQLAHLVGVGSDTVFGWVRNTNTIVSQVARATLGRPMIQYLSDDGEEFSFEGDALSYSKLRTLVQKMVEGLEERFKNLLSRARLSLDDLPKWEWLYDAIAKDDDGYSVISDERNQFDGLRNIFLEKLALNEEFCQLVGDNRLEWKIGAVKGLLAEIEEFTRLLLAVEYVTGGQPPRGSEICASLYQNLGSRIRTLCVASQALVNFAGHSKNSERLVAETSALRAPPIRVSSIQFMYLLIIRPADEFLSLLAYPEISARNLQRLSKTHVYYTNARLLQSPDLSKILKHWTLTYLGYQYGIKRMRHLMIHMGRDRILPSPKYRAAHDQFRAGEYLDRQAAHSSKMALSTYAIPESSRHTMSAADLHAWITICDIHHEFLGIKGAHVLSSQTVGQDKGADEVVDRDESRFQDLSLSTALAPRQLGEDLREGTVQMQTKKTMQPTPFTAGTPVPSLQALSNRLRTNLSGGQASYLLLDLQIGQIDLYLRDSDLSLSCPPNFSERMRLVGSESSSPLLLLREL